MNIAQEGILSWFIVLGDDFAFFCICLHAARPPFGHTQHGCVGLQPTHSSPPQGLGFLVCSTTKFLYYDIFHIREEQWITGVTFHFPQLVIVTVNIENLKINLASSLSLITISVFILSSSSSLIWGLMNLVIYSIIICPEAPFMSCLGLDPPKIRSWTCLVLMYSSKKNYTQKSQVSKKSNK